jgi:CRISPR/Cas system-associated exonuclease Cas4 (RecB family)
MLTEKAISEYGFCQYLLKEKAGYDKRMKEDRSSDMELLQEALSTGKPNKKAFVKPIPGGFKAESYEDNQDLWLVMDSANVTFLVTVREVRLIKSGGEWEVVVIRKKKYGHRCKEEEEVESLLQQGIWAAFNRAFDKPVKVISQVQGSDDLILMKEPDNFRGIEKMLEAIHDILEGDKGPIANFDNCYKCWWRDCPVRSKGEVGPSNGQPMIGMM